jgi:hypothetical protein
VNRGVRIALAGAAFMILAPLVGLALMVVADNVPDRLVMEHLFDATVDGSLDAEDYGWGYAGRRVDQFTECIAITVGVGDPAGVDTLKSAIVTPTLGKCSEAVPKIVGWAQGDGLSRGYDYYRYWHGHAFVLRPLIATLGVAGARILAVFALFGVAGTLAVRFARRFGRLAAALLVGPLIASTDFVDLPGTLPHALSMIVMLLTAILLLDRPPSTRAMSFGAGAVAGAVFVYVDILLNPPAAWALCVAAVGFGLVGRLSTIETAGRMAMVGSGWIVGYAWMWVSKWLLAAWVLGAGTVRSSITAQIDQRLDGDQAGVDHLVFAGVRANIREWWALPLAPLTLVAVVLAVTWGVRARRRAGGDRLATVDRWMLTVPALVPFVWFELLRNHSQVHAWFTYRSIAVAVGIAAAAWTARVVAGDPSALVEVEYPQHEAGDHQLAADRDGGHRRDDDTHRVGGVEVAE